MEGIKREHTLKPTPPLSRKFGSLYIPNSKRHTYIIPNKSIGNKNNDNNDNNDCEETPITSKKLEYI